jgi:hypothetical protein
MIGQGDFAGIELYSHIYTLRTMTQDIDPEERDRPVEITPQMIEAGLQALCNSGIADEYLRADKLLIAEIYRSMAAVAFSQSSDSQKIDSQGEK